MKKMRHFFQASGLQLWPGRPSSRPQSQVQQIDFTAEYFDYYAGWARIYEAGEIISSDDPNEHIYLHKIPLGVSVGICPWNFPVFVMARKLAPALVTGNTVVVKSSEAMRVHFPGAIEASAPARQRA